ncbi:hypothetical protein Tsubulata_036928 [Turnera subulata]|uniref:Protein DCL, chloroplastic n=1 Tax=Turnera subulata TaxID=218843 RepID=A0A9Q0FCT9_9ROSI|nr:hypothetical protein Tsubulata_036928 [Turnera subulata]
MAAPTFLRSFPLQRLRLHHDRSLAPAVLMPLRWNCSVAAESSGPDDGASSPAEERKATESLTASQPPERYWGWDPLDYRKWRNKEEEILKDIGPVVSLTRDILHTDRYRDGERLTAEDERIVVEELLAHHPNCEDKIGCGLDYIMVDRHPEFRNSRCLFVVRTDGAWIDFSYQKCIRAYVRHKYPTYAERFIRAHFKRRSSTL